MGPARLEGHFSKPALTSRQFAYASAMGHGENVYTPQVVVNGKVEGDGLEPGALAGLMSRGDRDAGGLSVGFSDGAVMVGRGAAQPAEPIYGSRAIPHAVEVTIPRGENAGHTLPYKHVGAK